MPLALFALAAAPAPVSPAVPAPLAASPRPAAGAPAAAPVAGPATPAGADHRKENKALVLRYLTEVLAAGRLDKLDEIVAKGFVDHTPGASVRRGPEAARAAQQKLRDLFLKVEYRPQALIAEGDQVAAHYLILATMKPEHPGAAAPPPLLLNGIALFRVIAGRIQEVFVLNDQVGLLRELGYTLVPPGAGPPANGAAGTPPGAPQPRSTSPPATPPANAAAGTPPAPSGTVPPRSTSPATVPPPAVPPAAAPPSGSHDTSPSASPTGAGPTPPPSGAGAGHGA